MTTYLFDGTENGLFTCIFKSFYEKQNPDVVTDKSVQTGFLDEIKTILTDEAKATRVLNCVKKCKTKHLYYDFTEALKSGEADKFTTIFKYLRFAITNKDSDISEAFSVSEVLAFRDMIMRINYEVHRFKGFIRFSETGEGFYYAHFEPDNDITEYLVPHFLRRMKRPFILHDTKRNIIALCVDGKYKIVHGGDTTYTVYLSEEETNFQNLWKSYYKSVNVAERKNTRQMKNYMPVRYWKNLTEKQDNIEDF